MTFPDPAPAPTFSPEFRPAKLGWVTVPIIIQMVLLVLSIILLPTLSGFLRAAMQGSAAANITPQQQQTMSLITGSFVWVVVILQIALLVLYYFVYRAVQNGREWGRVAAIVLFILNLFNFPVGTALGIFGLIGAFDAEVVAYCRRSGVS